MLTTNGTRFAPLFVTCGKSRGRKRVTSSPLPRTVPFDCEYCSNPCKLSRYHVGDHSLLWLLICCLNSGIYAVVAAYLRSGAQSFGRYALKRTKGSSAIFYGFAAALAGFSLANSY